MSEHLSFHSLWAHEEQRPRLLTPGVPIPSTCSWEPPECPQGQRTEPPRGEAGTGCRTACRRPDPAAHSRKASFRTEGAVNPGACLLGLAGEGERRPSEQAIFAGKASAGGLPWGPVCPRMACGKVPGGGQEGPFTTSRAGVSNLF